MQDDITQSQDGIIDHNGQFSGYFGRKPLSATSYGTIQVKEMSLANNDEAVIGAGILQSNYTRNSNSKHKSK